MSHDCIAKSTILVLLLALAGPAGAAVVLPFPGASKKKPSCEDNAALPPATRLGPDDARVHKDLPARVRVADHGRFEYLDFEIPRGHELDKMSADGKFYVLVDTEYRHSRLFEKATGRMLAERRAKSTGFTFSSDSKYAVLRSGDTVEIVDLRVFARPIAKYNLGSVVEKFARPDGSTFTVDARGEIYYLPKAHELVCFFDRHAPLVLRLLGPSTFQIAHLGEPPDLDPVEAEFGWRSVGYVSPSNRTLATEVLNMRSHHSRIELFDLTTRAHRATVKLATNFASEFAISPSDRFFAVALPRLGVIQVFDLERSSQVPRWEIKLPDLQMAFVRQVRFVGENTLLVARDEAKAILEFHLR